LTQCLHRAYVEQDAYSLWGGVPRSAAQERNVTELVTWIQQHTVDGALTGFSDPLAGGMLAQDLPTDKAGRHNYTLNYDWLLRPWQQASGDRKLSPLHVLEVGVKAGGSIKLWREYFGPSSRVFGLDIDPSVPQFPRDANIKILAPVDSGNMSQVMAFLGPPGESFFSDITVDDGLHTERGIMRTFTALVG